MKTEISIAIVTKNRPIELEQCLNSLMAQNKLPAKTILVDNDLKQSAKKLAHNYKYSLLNIDYHSCAGTVPKCRNLAIKLAKTKYLAFVDDDCVLNSNWLKIGLQTIVNKKTDFVLGKTKLLNSHNILALAQHARDAYWKNQQKQVFDTKNVILDLEIIKKHGLFFDNQCQLKHYDSADFDFDFQSKKHRLKKGYCPKMILFHQESVSWKRFKDRTYCRGYLGHYLNQKWQLNHRLTDLRDQNLIFFLLKTVKNFFKNHHQYQKYMETSSILKKYIAILFISLFERYYTLGYADRQKTLISKNN